MNTSTNDASMPGLPQVGEAKLSKLALRRVAIDTYRENMAYLHRQCPVYRVEGFQALSKVGVRLNGHTILATLNVADDACIVGCHGLGPSEGAYALFDVQEGQTASMAQAEPPVSISALHRKIAAERLNAEDFHAIVKDIASLRYC